MNFNYCNTLTVKVPIPLQWKELVLKHMPQGIRGTGLGVSGTQGMPLHPSSIMTTTASCWMWLRAAAHKPHTWGSPTGRAASLQQSQLPHPKKPSHVGLQMQVGSAKTEGCLHGVPFLQWGGQAAHQPALHLSQFAARPIKADLETHHGAQHQPQGNSGLAQLRGRTSHKPAGWPGDSSRSFNYFHPPMLKDL